MTARWYTDIYNIFDVELWKDGVFLRVIEKEYPDCEQLQTRLNNGTINPKQYLTSDDTEGIYEIKFGNPQVKVKCKFEARRG